MFFPIAIDISTRFLYIVGYSRHVDNETSKISYYKVNLYLMEISFNNCKYDIKFHCTWISDSLILYFLDMTFLSLAVNDANEGRKILIGIPSANTVHLLFVDYTLSIRLQHISSKTQFSSTLPKVYGTGVA